MKRKDQGLQELIAAAKSHPELFDQAELGPEIKRMLKTRSARSLAKGLDPAAFVSADGALEPIRMCGGGTGIHPHTCHIFTMIFAEKAA